MFPQNPVKLKYVAGQAAEFSFAGAGSRGSIPLAGVHRDGMLCEGGRVSRLPCRFEGRQPSSGCRGEASLRRSRGRPLPSK